ncbi:hypothetical protein DVH24_017550 [Malus domestica]|uniref:Uncharacterized protein n=1 Tax=Malus domestica TaxID=3750 RepID=A0A498KD91_MALDO|nr:hypothetical protein DVH24_017550 [Malus domestica]
MPLFLDKELAASGFTRKDQEDIEKVSYRCEACSLKEVSIGMLVLVMKKLKMTHTCVLNETNIEGVDSLRLLDQDQTSNLNHEEKGVDDGLRNCEAGPSTKPECEDASDKVGPEIVFILCFLHGLEVRIYLGLGVCCLSWRSRC